MHIWIMQTLGFSVWLNVLVFSLIRVIMVIRDQNRLPRTVGLLNINAHFSPSVHFVHVVIT
jgi:hypothetical protein